MTSAKELFLKPDPTGGQSLCQWWTTISHDDRFHKVLMTVRAHLLENGITEAQIAGVALTIEALLTLTDNEPEGLGIIPSPGLHHHNPKKEYPELAAALAKQKTKTTKIED